MPLNFDVGSFASGAASGASIGSLFGPVGTGVGAGIGALGSLFGESRQQRFKKLLDQLAQYEKMGLENIGRTTAGQVAEAGAGAEKLTRSLGRATEVGAYKLPFQTNAATAGVNAKKDFMQQIAGERLNLEENRPYDPSFTDVLSSVAPAALSLKQNKDLMSLLSGESGGSLPSSVDTKNSLLPTSEHPLTDEVFPGNNSPLTNEFFPGSDGGLSKDIFASTDYTPSVDPNGGLLGMFRNKPDAMYARYGMEKY